MRLIHFSKKPVKRVLSRKSCQRIDNKPHGFWFSVEGNNDGWKWWCEAESFALDRFEYENEIELMQNANLCVLSSALDIDLFHEKFKALPKLMGESERFGAYIDWEKVTQKFQGIIIAPYIWNRRLNGEAHRWYYSWDCASGCIWDARAIREIRVLESNRLNEIPKQG